MRLSLAGASGGTRTLATGTLSIGRGERNDWQLPDPDRHLSKTHCVISEENGRFILTDLSTNGVYVNGARQPTSRDSRITLTDGDEFRIGEYSITVDEVAAPPPSARAGGGRESDPLDIDPLDDPLGRPHDPAFSHPVTHTPAARRVDDPFDREDENRHRPARPDDDLFSGVTPAVNWTGPSQADHADAPRHAMPVPRVVAPPVNISDIDFDALIGDMSPFATPASVPPPPTPAPAPQPSMSPQQLANYDPFAELDSLMAPPAAAPPPPAAAMPPPPPAPMTAPTPQQAPAPPQTAAPQIPVPQTVAPQAAPPVQSPAASQAEAMQAALRLVLEGAGVPGMPAGADAEAALRNVGQVFRALTEGLREVLMSRAAIKGELRVEQTLLKSSNNNALKFSFSPDDAVVALLSAGRPGYMAPIAATREAFHDIKTHELAVMAGVQTALTGLLQRFSPETLESRITAGKLSSVLPGARKARLWDSFRELYATIASEAEDDFQAVFGRAFAKAYKAQVQRE